MHSARSARHIASANKPMPENGHPCSAIRQQQVDPDSESESSIRNCNNPHRRNLNHRRECKQCSACDRASPHLLRGEAMLPPTGAWPRPKSCQRFESAWMCTGFAWKSSCGWVIVEDCCQIKGFIPRFAGYWTSECSGFNHYLTCLRPSRSMPCAFAKGRQRFRALPISDPSSRKHRQRD
jgi:hypothetical protein